MTKLESANAGVPKSSNNNNSKSTRFGLFPYLSDDLKLSILSFIADAPLEVLQDNYTQSALTHHLPSVSRKFRAFARHDLYWKTALARQVAREPMLWRQALLDIICTASSIDASSSKTSASSVGQSPSLTLQPTSRDSELLEQAHCVLGKPAYKEIYQTVVSRHLRYSGPMVCQIGLVQFGDPYEVLFTDVVNVRALENALRHLPTTALDDGETLPPHQQVLLGHANRGPVACGTPALLVRILRCFRSVQQPQPDSAPDMAQRNANEATAMTPPSYLASSYRVVLLPVAHVWIEHAWNQGGIVHAQCLKMGRQVTANMNRLAQQEALAHVMDQMTLNFTNWEEDDDDDDHDDSSLDTAEMFFDQEEER